VNVNVNATKTHIERAGEQKKVLLSMEFERQQKEARLFTAQKRPRLLGTDAVPATLPRLTNNDFDLLKKICPIMKIFDTVTKKVCLCFMLVNNY
jgi:hypothetical protein